MAQTTCPRCGQLLMATGRCMSCNESFPVALDPVGARLLNDRRYRRYSLIAYLVIALAILGLAGRMVLKKIHLPHLYLQPVSRSVSTPQSLRHAGPVARLDQLKGSGRIYLVQIGDHKDPYSLQDLAGWLHSKYSLDVQVLPPLSIDKFAWNASRRQYIAESIDAQMKRAHPDLSADPDVVLIGFTDADMYTDHFQWRGTFTQRDMRRTAIISSDGMQDDPLARLGISEATAREHFQTRLRRILLKDVAILYWHLPLNDDSTSLLHNTLDPDIPAQDIYETDLDPALRPEGEKEDEPCIYFDYSAKQGVKPMPGPLIRSCGDAMDPEEDPTVERFEVDLRLGLLLDRHTDFSLPDDIPIQFERVTRDGWSGKNPFGISGTDIYDEFLSSPDNITITVIAADTSRREYVRSPREVSNLSLAKYVDKTDPGFNEMHWRPTPYEHYDLTHFDGAVKAYLPCSGPTILCYLTGYRNPQGQELKFERDQFRRLVRLTSPNQSSIRIEYNPPGIISRITDTTGRVVNYGYDANNRLISVTYPSGETFHYEYDDTQHLLAFSVSSSQNSKPSVLMRNEYANGLLVKQTFADGSVYSYKYGLSDNRAVSGATVQSADGREFNVDVGRHFSTVHEKPGHANTEKRIASK